MSEARRVHMTAADDAAAACFTKQTHIIHSSETISIKICEIRMIGYSVFVVYCIDKCLDVFTSVCFIRYSRWYVVVVGGWVGGGGHCPAHRWCEGTLGVKKSTEETVGIALN